MTHRTFSLVTAIIFSLVALLMPSASFVGGRSLSRGSHAIWINWIGLAIAAYLAYQGFQLRKTPTNRFHSSDSAIQPA